MSMNCRHSRTEFLRSWLEQGAYSCETISAYRCLACGKNVFRRQLEAFPEAVATDQLTLALGA